MTGDDKRWWDVIAAGCPHTSYADGWDLTLYETVVQLHPDDILCFDIWLFDRAAGAYRQDLWRAATITNGACTDDGFHYFRNWLVGAGREIYEAALRDPDMLADVTLPGECEFYCDGLCRVAWTEKTGRTGEEYWELFRSARPGPYPPLRRADWPDDDDELRRRFPRLHARYLMDDEG